VWEAGEFFCTGDGRGFVSRFSVFVPSFWKGRLGWLLLFGAVGVLAGSPFVFHLLSLSHDPLYAEAVFRSGIHPSHLPESWAYSILFFAMAAGILIALVRHPAFLRPFRYAIVTVLAGFVALNQQIIHGQVFMFASHYLFALILAAIISLLLSVRFVRSSHWLLLSLVASAIYLAAIGYDGRYVLTQNTAKAGDFRTQHFASALPVLDRMPRTTILSDSDTSLFLAGATKHDVVYALYLKNVLISHEELARRYCLSVLAAPPSAWHIAAQPLLLWPDADGAYKNDPSVRQREVRLVTQACTAMDSDPKAALHAFGVRYILWDTQQHPQWDLRRLKVSLTKTASGEGWELWKVQ
jgi:hypothetical protein